MKKKEYSIEIGGKTLTAEFNDLADQTNGSVLIRYGNTVIFATAVISKDAKEGQGFFPLTVDYEEKFYASGQILGSRFQRREGRPSDEAILSGRIVDRTIRPLFPQHIRHEVQVVITVLSLDQDDPDVLGVLGASLALGTSDIPWNGPVSAIRIGKKKNADTFIVNPTYSLREEPEYELDLVACGKEGLTGQININMIEVGAKEINNKLAINGLTFATEEIEKLQKFQEKIIKEIGKKKKVIAKPETPVTLIKLFAEIIEPKLVEHVFSGAGHTGSEKLIEEWKKLAEEKLSEEESAFAFDYFEERVNEVLHEEALKHERRADGRKLDEVRKLYVQAGGISPILHGSGIFYRGGTHVLSALTLGGPQDSQIIDGMETKNLKRFMHHYNFPPFSSGETGRMGGTNRRMIGHGALAEKALSAVIPPKEIFPYTIRIVSESMASNGSTSMASTCASSLALMDAGVPVKAHVAGIAMGLMLSGEKYKVLTDIQGPEDHHGDMDFKVAGTREGITAIQLDIKVDGIPLPVLSEALEKAEKARQHILDTMETAIKAPRVGISPNAPKIVAIKIKQDQIGLVIGPGGKMIKGIKEKTGAEIEIEDDGTVFITGKNGSAEAAQKMIEGMTREYKRGDKAEGEVVKILDFGAFVKISDFAEGLVHISEMAPFRVDKIEKYLKIGDKVPVVVKEIDEKGRVNLSIKQANPEFFKKPL